MKVSDILSIYDAEYASVYNECYLLADNYRECTAFEIDCIRRFLRPSSRWLDVACGTGYLLSRFPETERAGLDLSPAMLEVARRCNPGVSFAQADFRVDVPDWKDRWDLVTSTWYAYN